MQLHDFPGGLRLAHHKAASLTGAIRLCPLPAALQVPLRQHAGPAAEPVVQVGERVCRGQLIARASGERSLNVHAPAAGIISDVVMAPLPGPELIEVPHIVITVDGDQHSNLLPLDWQTATTSQLLDRIREAGIAGLGGAGFPSADKLSPGPNALILNGVECEPYIACDEALLAERADDVVLGGRMLARILGAEQIVLALQDDMHAALEACERALRTHGDDCITLVRVPNRYPQGGERQLIQTLTGREVPLGGLPRDLGVLVHNVGTAAAAWRAVAAGEALTTRIVTVAGSGVRHPGNFEVALGTPVSALIEAAGGYTPLASRLLIGGPMMGTALPHDGFAISKTSNCVLVLSDAELRDASSELPCIRCGECAVVCPAKLLPQLLLTQVRQGDLDAAHAQGLAACIECGACDLACPSHIALTAHFRFGKAQRAIHERERELADAARQRHLARQQRLVRDEQARAAKHIARASDATAKDAVAAALERARTRRQRNDSEMPP